MTSIRFAMAKGLVCAAILFTPACTTVPSSPSVASSEGPIGRFWSVQSGDDASEFALVDVRAKDGSGIRVKAWDTAGEMTDTDKQLDLDPRLLPTSEPDLFVVRTHIFDDEDEGALPVFRSVMGTWISVGGDCTEEGIVAKYRTALIKEAALRYGVPDEEDCVPYGKLPDDERLTGFYADPAVLGAIDPEAMSTIRLFPIDLDIAVEDMTWEDYGDGASDYEIGGFSAYLDPAKLAQPKGLAGTYRKRSDPDDPYPDDPVDFTFIEHNDGGYSVANTTANPGRMWLLHVDDGFLMLTESPGYNEGDYGNRKLEIGLLTMADDGSLHFHRLRPRVPSMVPLLARYALKAREAAAARQGLGLKGPALSGNIEVEQLAGLFNDPHWLAASQVNDWNLFFGEIVTTLYPVESEDKETTSD